MAGTLLALLVIHIHISEMATTVLTEQPVDQPVDHLCNVEASAIVYERIENCVVLASAKEDLKLWPMLSQSWNNRQGSPRC